MSDHVTRKGLCEQRADIGAQMTELVKNQDPTEGLSNDEHAKFKQMETDFDRLSERIKEFDAVEERLKALESVRETTARTEYVANERTAPTNRITERDKELALRGWMRRDSPTEPTAKEDEAMKKVGIRENSKMLAANLLQRAPRSASEVAEAYAEAAELRATSDFQNTSTGADGGNTVPNEMMANVEIFMVAYSGVRRAGAEIFRTATGGTLPIPIMDDTATTALGAIIAQNTASTQHGVPFAQVTLSPKTYTSRHIGVSWELMQDTSVNLAALLGEAIGTRIGRIQNVHFTIGVSSDGQPIGFLEASTNSSNASAVGVTSSTYNELIYNEVVSLLHSVDQAYRSDPSCGWQFTDTTLAVVPASVGHDGAPPVDSISGWAGSRCGARLSVHDQPGRVQLPVHERLVQGFGVRQVANVQNPRAARD